MAIADLCGFSQAFEKELARARKLGYPLCAVCVDVERAPEEVVSRVEHLLDAASRASDTATMAGEGEFVVLLPETTSEGAEVLARRLYATMRESLWSPGEAAMHVGVAQLDASMDGSALLTAARAAVEHARFAATSIVHVSSR
jgi:GGDEF domain-containing protein